MTQYTARGADDLRLELPPRAPKPNEAVLAMLRDLDTMKKNMPESDPSDTNRYIREGRSGAMYGESPNNIRAVVLDANVAVELSP